MCKPCRDVGSGKRRPMPELFAGHGIADGKTLRCRSDTRTPSTPSPAYTEPIARHGRRSHEIPPPQSVVVASPGAPAKPRHIALQARNDCDNMAQGEGSPAVSREADYPGEEEHRGDTAESDADILRTTRQEHPPRAHTDNVRNQMKWYPSYSAP